MFPKPVLIATAVVLLALTTLPGCFQSGVRVNSTLSPSVEQIPTVVGIYPLLSSPVRPHGSLELSMRKLTSSGVDEREAYIVPPTETKLVLTQQSQIMTDLLSAELASGGFTLKQLPVELRDGDDKNGDGNGEVFVMSLSLLNHLQENYDLGAVVLGNVFFVTDPYDRTVQVSVAYLKVVDVQTLDVLAQITGIYDKPGESIGAVANSMAAELTAMAGLSGR
jgi:hypothetical protein